MFGQIITNSDDQKPSGRMYHSIIFDGELKKLILFPGFLQHGWTTDIQTNDLWYYNLNNDDWEYEGLCFTDTAETRPGITTIAYDTESKKYITFDNEGRTWSFDINTAKWINMTPGESPVHRCGQGMAYDEESDRIIMFGGFGCKGVNDSVYSDTWSYDYNSNTWTQMSPKNQPSERMYFAIAYDKSNDRIVLWGGRKLEPIFDNKIWLYDFNSDKWESRVTKNGPSQPFAYPAMVYREKSDDIFLFGGAKLESPFIGETVNDSWIYKTKTNNWEKVTTKTKPPKLANLGLTYDKINDRIILFGGEIDSLYTNNVSNETWIYDPSNDNWNRSK